MNSKKILYIIGGNITTAPRALKSIISLHPKYDLAIAFINKSNLWIKFDKEFLKETNIPYKNTSLLRQDFIQWSKATSIHEIAKSIYPFFKNSLTINAYASNKGMISLQYGLRKIKNNFDLIIAHTYPAIYPAYKFAKKHNIPFIFDVEDYHPGEKCSPKEKMRREFLMKKILPQAAFFTYASPMIGEYTLKLIGQYPTDKHALINNSFPQKEFTFKQNDSEKIKFVWFSQNISQGRGLELVLPALHKYKHKIEFHLIGNLYTDFYNNFLKKYADFIVIHKPLPQKELNLKLAEFDVGLALEISNVDINKQIAVSNKIWAYFQSGLYILATDTPAQVKFLSEHKNTGLIAQQNTEDFNLKIRQIINNIDQIREEKKQRYEYAQKFSWETEAEKLLKIVHNILESK